MNSETEALPIVDVLAETTVVVLDHPKAEGGKPLVVSSPNSNKYPKISVSIIIMFIIFRYLNVYPLSYSILFCC